MDHFLLGSAFYGSQLVTALTYTWAQDSDQMVNFFVVPIKAKYLPFVMLVIDVVSNGPVGVFGTVTGIVAAHTYLFLDTLWPLYGGARWLDTPRNIVIDGLGAVAHNVFGTGRPEPRRPVSGSSTGAGPRIASGREHSAATGSSTGRYNSVFHGQGRRLGR